MTIVKVQVPERIFREFPDVKWDDIARKAVMEEFRKIASRKMMDELFQDSDLSENDCIDLGRKVNKSLRTRYEKELNS